jgi:hypothetical protein
MSNNKYGSKVEREKVICNAYAYEKYEKIKRKKSDYSDFF